MSPSKIRSIINAAPAATMSCSPTQPVVYAFRRVRGNANGLRPPMKARRLIEALPAGDHALWASAMYAGLRHGELRALQVRDIDLERRRINVKRGWDQYEGEIDPKSEKGTRFTIITKPLLDLLASHLRDTGRKDTDLVFGRTQTKPFQTNTVNKRARKGRVAAQNEKDRQNRLPTAERVRQIGLQECRHTAVSQMLDAGIAIDKVSKFMGHASSPSQSTATDTSSPEAKTTPSRSSISTTNGQQAG
jgi:integrase